MAEYDLTDEVHGILGVYADAGISPAPRAIALRALEECVELALECGASVRDVFVSLQVSLGNEQLKDPSRGYDEHRIGSPDAICSEIADVSLLVATTAERIGLTDSMVQKAASFKVSRLRVSFKTGNLHFTEDGRFYRRDAK